MKISDLVKLIKNGESERIEFKRSTGRRTDAAKAVCAMLNGEGGYVFFGVSDKGQLLGQEVTDATITDVVRELRRIDPPAFPELEQVKLENGRSILVIKVPENDDLYSYDGRPYIRHGPTTSVMPREEYQRRLMEKVHARNRWENQPVPDGVSARDLDEEEILITVEEAIRLGRIDPSTRRDVETILRGLELIRGGKLLNAAVVLYGQSDQLKTLYPQMSIRLARFRGRDRLAEFADNRQYWGHAFALLRRAESFLMDHVPIAGRVVPGKMIREDQPWYPPLATRETLANALCHRDYTIPGGAVAVAMYDDHLEITNPGVLHFGITPEKLTKPHESKPWNPIIANVFYRAGIIERWGTGTLNIIDWCRENSNPPPSWQEQADSVYVTFLPAVLPATPEVTPPVTPPVTQPVKRLLNLLSNRGDMGARAIREALGLKDRTHTRDAYISPALHEGLIEYTIPQKPTSRLQKYHLTKKGTKWLENATSAD